MILHFLEPCPVTQPKPKSYTHFCPTSSYQYTPWFHGLAFTLAARSNNLACLVTDVLWGSWAEGFWQNPVLHHYQEKIRYLPALGSTAKLCTARECGRIRLSLGHHCFRFCWIIFPRAFLTCKLRITTVLLQLQLILALWRIIFYQELSLMIVFLVFLL